jgi:putative MFS transporter
VSRDHSTSYKDLFGQVYRGLFLKTSALWFLIAFMFYAQLTLLPFWLKNSEKSFKKLFLSLLGEFPVCIIAFIFVEKKSCGRKRMLIIFAVLETLTALLMYFLFDQNALLVPCLFINRFFMKGLFSILYVYTSEIFPTNIRVIGYGWANSIGKFSSFLMPFIIFYLYDIEQKLPLITFIVCGVIACGVSISLPFDTWGRELDVIQGVVVKGGSMIELSENNSFCTENYLSMNNKSFEIRYSDNYK